MHETSLWMIVFPFLVIIMVEVSLAVQRINWYLLCVFFPSLKLKKPLKWYTFQSTILNNLIKDRNKSIILHLPKQIEHIPRKEKNGHFLPIQISFKRKSRNTHHVKTYTKLQKISVFSMSFFHAGIIFGQIIKPMKMWNRQLNLRIDFQAEIYLHFQQNNNVVSFNQNIIKKKRIKKGRFEHVVNLNWVWILCSTNSCYTWLLYTSIKISPMKNAWIFPLLTAAV